MNIKTAACAAALVLGSGLAFGQSSVQVYGRVSEFVANVKTGNQGGVTGLTDHASRLGFMGKEDLGGGLTALFGMEMGLAADTGAATTPMYRNSYVGLGSQGLGTVALGRLDSFTPVGAPIYSQVARIVDFVGYDAGPAAINGTMLNSRNRTSNAIGYATPVIGGFTARARYYMRGDGLTPALPENDARSLDVGVEYGAGPLVAAVSYGKDQRKGGLAANEFEDKWQVGARYTLGSFAPYVLYGRERFNNTATTRGDVDYWLAGASWTGGAHKVVLNVMKRDVQASLIGERKRWQTAYIYSLSKRTELQAYFDRDGVDSSKDNVKVRAVGLGIRHLF